MTENMNDLRLLLRLQEERLKYKDDRIASLKAELERVAQLYNALANELHHWFYSPSKHNDQERQVGWVMDILVKHQVVPEPEDELGEEDDPRFDRPWCDDEHCWKYLSPRSKEIIESGFMSCAYPDGDWVPAAEHEIGKSVLEMNQMILKTWRRRPRNYMKPAVRNEAEYEQGIKCVRHLDEHLARAPVILENRPDIANELMRKFDACRLFRAALDEEMQRFRSLNQSRDSISPS